MMDDEKKVFHTRNESLILLDIQERERKRIARDLHDSPLQNLTHLIHLLELSSLFIDQDSARAKLEIADASKKLKGIIEDIRNIIYDLRPMEFDDLGFYDSLKNMIYKLQKETEIFIDLEMKEEISITNQLIFLNVYRIMKECMINSIKHSEATEIKITVYKENGILYSEIKDNGRGFDHFTVKERKNHFGLQILEERVQLLMGTLDVQSSVGKTCGTMITIKIPLENGEL